MANTYQMIGNVLVASLQGRLNNVNAAQTEAEILQHINHGTTDLLLDLAELDYISSAGLRIVLIAAKRLKMSAGRLVLCGIQDATREVFEISGFMNVLTVADTRERALEHFA